MEGFFADNPWLVITAGLWTLPWKGLALWKAARSSQKAWFIVFLAVHTLGLLEILYLFVFSRGGADEAAAGGKPSGNGTDANNQGR